MVTYGSRIKFYEVEDNIFMSYKIYSNGIKQVQVVVDKNNMSFRFIDPVSMHTVYQFAKKVNNYEVLQRNIKRDLVKHLGIAFTKETRQVNSDE